MASPDVFKAEALSAFIEPNGVAVIGVSRDETKIGARCLRILLHAGYKGVLVGINPVVQEVYGVPCYPALADVPNSIDLAIIAVPAKKVATELNKCAQAGIKGAVVFAGGFAEIDGEGAARQDEIRDICAQTGLRVLGPNTVGIFSPRTRVMATFATAVATGGLAPSGPITLLSQSGAIAAFLYAKARTRGIGLDHVVALGNESDITLSDFLAYAAQTPHVKAIGGYIEGLRDGSAFIEAATSALNAGKFVAFVKAGKSSAGAEAVMSHTAAIAGPENVYRSLFGALGVASAEDPDELLEMLDVASRWRARPRGSRVGLVTASGGLGALAADLLASRGISLARLSPSTLASLRERLPPISSIANPVDLTGQILHDQNLIGDCTSLVASDQNVDVTIVMFGFQSDRAGLISQQIVDVSNSEGTGAIAVLWIDGPSDAVARLRECGVPVFDSLGNCIRATVPVMQHAEFANRHILEREIEDPNPEATQSRLTTWRQQMLSYPSGHIVPESQAKLALAAIDIPTPEGDLVMTKEAALEAAYRLGYPVALKAQLPGVIHKSEIGALSLGVQSKELLVAEFNRLRSLRRDVFPILVEAMESVTTEAILGYVNDATFGPLISFGPGGSQVEDRGGIEFRPLPMSRKESRMLVRDVVAKQGWDDDLLQGESLQNAIYMFGLAAFECKDIIKEMEINPLSLASNRRPIALDAVIVVRENGDTGHDS